MEATAVQDRILKIGAFGGLDRPVADKVVSVLMAIADQEEWEGGHEFIREGDATNDHGYVLLSGAVRVQKSNGKDLEVSAPALLGEMKQHSTTGKRGATVTTSGPCTVLVFDWSALHSRLSRELAAGDWSAFRIALERYSWDYLLGEGL